MALTLDGRAAARALKERLAGRLRALQAAGVEPALVMIRVGEDPASAVYVAAKEKASQRLGLRSETIVLPADVSATALRAEIERCNADPLLHGVLLQLPLPAHLPQEDLLAAIDPHKDVDGFHPVNVGRLCLGLPGFVPATPLGILRLLQHYEIEIAGRRVVILGRSRIVGRPLANLLSAQAPTGNATVTLCHSRTRDIAAVTREAEILVAAVGRRAFVKAQMVAPGAIVIDVGMHREPDPQKPDKSRLFGDVDFDAVEPRVAAITPVPRGVGPMTVACLLENTIQAAEWSHAQADAGTGG